MFAQGGWGWAGSSQRGDKCFTTSFGAATSERRRFSFRCQCLGIRWDAAAEAARIPAKVCFNVENMEKDPFWIKCGIRGVLLFQRFFFLQKCFKMFVKNYMIKKYIHFEKISNFYRSLLQHFFWSNKSIIIVSTGFSNQMLCVRRTFWIFLFYDQLDLSICMF